MKFTEHYPLPPREYAPPKDYYPPATTALPVFYSHRIYPCLICKSVTGWCVDSDGMELHICSDECLGEHLLAQPFEPFGRSDPRVDQISAKDADYLSGEPEPLKIDPLVKAAYMKVVEAGEQKAVLEATAPQVIEGQVGAVKQSELEGKT